MRYWMALAFIRDTLTVGEPTQLGLERWVEALRCTKRNAQLVIKRLQEDHIIDWIAGVGRGNLPTVTLLYSVNVRIEQEAERLLGLNKVESALSLIEPIKQDQFLSQYITRHRYKHPQQLLQIPFYRATHSLDPIDISRRSEAHIGSYLYSRLLRWDKKLSGYRGELALHWEVVPKGLAIILRKGASFHDGSPLLAEDVAAHFERLIASSSHNAALFKLIDNIEIDSPYRLTFYSPRAHRILPKLLALGAMGISKLNGNAVIGSGPFSLAEQNEWRTVLHTYSGYHGYRPWVDGVEIWNIGKEAKSLSTNADMVNTSLLNQTHQSDFEHHSQWEMGAEYTLLNSNRPHLNTPSQRQALMEMIEKIGLPDSIIAEEVKPASSLCSVFSPQPLMVDKRPSLTDWPDRKLCPPPLTIATYQLDQHIRYAKHLALTLRHFGIGAEVKVYEYPQFCLAENLNNADVIVSGEVFGDDTELDYIDWLMTNSALKHSLSSELKNWLDSAMFDALNQPTEAKRIEALQQIETQLKAKAVFKPLFHVKQQISTANTLNATEMLANGWIDFASVVVS